MMRRGFLRSLFTALGVVVLAPARLLARSPSAIPHALTLGSLRRVGEEVYACDKNTVVIWPLPPDFRLFYFDPNDPQFQQTGLIKLTSKARAAWPCSVKPGDKVRLNSGGPLMEVSAIFPPEVSVFCEWTDRDGGKHAYPFAPQMLTVEEGGVS